MKTLNKKEAKLIEILKGISLVQEMTKIILEYLNKPAWSTLSPESQEKKDNQKDYSGLNLTEPAFLLHVGDHHGYSAGKDLEVHNLSYSTLVGINFSGFNLREANLKGADLSYADLRKTNIYIKQISPMLTFFRLKCLFAKLFWH